MNYNFIIDEGGIAAGLTTAIAGLVRYFLI